MLVKLMQYMFLASIGFDALVAVWFMKQSWHIRTRIVQLYYLTILTIIAWEIVTYISFFYQKSEEFNFIFNASTFSLGLASIFMILIFVWYFTNQKFFPSILIWMLLFGTIITMSLAYVPHVMVGEKIFAEQSSLFYLANAPLTIPFYIFILIQFFLLVIILVNGFRNSVERKKREVKIIIIGFGGGATVTILTYVIVPFIIKFFTTSSDIVTLSIAMQQIVSSIFVSILSVAIAYAILRYRIFNIHYKLKRAALTLTLYVMGLLIFLFFVFLARFQGYYFGEANILFVISIGLVLMIFLKKIVHQLLKKNYPEMFIDTYQLTSYEKKVTDGLPPVDVFIRQSVSSLMQTLPLEHMIIYIYDPRTVCFKESYPDTGHKIAADEPWLIALENKKQDNTLVHILNQWNCIKLSSVPYHDQTLAIIGFGRRIDGNPFSAEDERNIEHFIQLLAINLWQYLHLKQLTFNAIDAQQQLPQLNRSAYY